MDAQPTPSGRLLRWLITHLATIGQQMGDRDGNGSFQRKDVEAWLNISSSQASNVLKFGQEHGYVTRLPGYRYQLTAFAEAALASAETKPRMEEIA